MWVSAQKSEKIQSCPNIRDEQEKNARRVTFSRFSRVSLDTASRDLFARVTDASVNLTQNQFAGVTEIKTDAPLGRLESLFTDHLSITPQRSKRQRRPQGQVIVRLRSVS